MVCILSVVVISLQDHEDHNAKPSNLIGNILALIDSFLYAVYGILIYVLLPPEKQSNYDFTLILAFMGLLTILTGPIFLAAAHLTGVETFELPPLETLGFLTFDSFVGVNYEFWLARSTSLIGPLTANVSLAAIIPFTMIIDFFWTFHKYSVFYVVASACIIQAVLCMNIEEN